MRKQFVALLSTVAILVTLASSNAFALSNKRKNVKNNMSKNYQVMNELMANILIHNDYPKIVSTIGELQKHVDQLKKMPIENKGAHQYRVNIENLNSQIFSLKFTAEKLVAAEKMHKTEQGYWLRPKAAEHFGQILKTCVSCHYKVREIR
jgi:hypothetical protein